MDRCIVDEDVFDSESTRDSSTINNISATHIEASYEGIYSTIAIDTTATTSAPNKHYYKSKISTVNHDLYHYSCSSRPSDHILNCHS